jgi:glycosyltransferase involved in cell wall biosynthesis
MKPRVLVVATSRKTRGGITSVVKAHETGEQWNRFHCRWIQTHRDGPVWRKLWYLVTALIEYMVLLPWYDIVHIHVATTQSARRKKLFFVLAKLLHKKTILHFHPSNEKFLYEPNNQQLYRNLFSRADLVLVLSEQWRRWIKDALGLTEHIEVLYNPCPNVEQKPELKQKEILFAGTVIPRKGYADLIRGFAKITTKHIDWKVVIAGNGEIDKAKAIAKECGIEKQVEFLGWVSGEAKALAFQRASIYCLASDGEGFPMGVLDAWAYGIPCVMTPVGGIPDLVKDGADGLIFPVGDIDKLATCMEKLITNDNMRMRIVENTDKMVYGMLSVEQINKRLGQIYKKVYNSNH